MDNLFWEENIYKRCAKQKKNFVKSNKKMIYVNIYFKDK